MTVRLAAVLAMGGDDELSLAMLEDTYEVVAGLARVRAVLAVPPVPARGWPEVEAVTWPGTPVIRLPAETAAAHPAGMLLGTFAGLVDLGAEEAVVVAGDAPDLPPLLLGKLYRALGSAEVAACPAEGGGLVALAARLPVPPWLADADAGMDTPDAWQRLAAAAPRRRALASGPGWHRIRAPEDLARLDPGLEGWDATRALLTRRP